MDTSETYIKMCERAKEIQENWLPKLGDWICSATRCLRNKQSKRNVRVVQYIEIKRDLPIIHARESMGTMDAKYRIDVIWLPRQDQLQAILNWDTEQLIAGLIAFATRICSKSHLDYDKLLIARLLSMEQLWLAFVMKECYDKIWNGEGWETSV